MPRLLALEWNSGEARVVAAASRGGRAVIEHAFSVDLAAPEEAGQEQAAGPGEQLAEAMRQHGIARGEALVAIGRTNIELRQMTLPPAPDEELPDLVRMQAMREFGALEEDWLLDFIPSASQPDQPRSVLAAAIDPESVSQIHETCQAAGLKAHRLVLRPCGAASLLCRFQADRAAQLRLLVDLLADEADLTAVVDGKVTFLRTARLPGDPLAATDAAAMLLGEIRRTMAAVQNQLGGRAVESIVLCGTGDMQAALARAIEQATAVPTELFDPFAGLEIGGELRRDFPDRPWRFAPLLGILLDELDETPQAIDFLHPRRRPAPPDRRKQYLAAGVAAAVLVLGYLGYNWWQAGQLRSQIAELAQRSRLLEQPAVQADKTAQVAAELNKWADDEVIWLDEIRELCEDLPPAQDIMLLQLTLGGTGAHGGEIKLEGVARSPESIDKLEAGLRDAAHRVEGKGRSLDTQHKNYPWRFTSLIYVEPDQRR